MPTEREVVDALLAQRRFAALRVVAPLLDLSPEACSRVVRLADAGDRLLDLDAEDFEAVAAEVGVPSDIVSDSQAATFPQHPRAPNRGSMDSLVPLYRLMLDALDARLRRQEPMHVVALLHLMSEYLPLLAWESTLGHAGDPLRLLSVVTVPGSLWGTRSLGCYHTSSQRGAAERVMHIGSADDAAWEAYLNRFHSRVAEAMGRCATHPHPGRPALEGVCRVPCTVWEQFPATVKESVGARVHLARGLAESPVVELRHHAPVGHFFGVPSWAEVHEAWERSWKHLTRPWQDGGNPLTAPAAPLPELPDGVAMIVSAVAGREVRQGRILAGIRDLIVSALEIPTAVGR